MSQAKPHSHKWLQGAVPSANKGIYTTRATQRGHSVAQQASLDLASSKTSTEVKREAAFAKRAQKGF